MIGQHIRFGSYSGVVVEEFTKGRRTMLRVKLDEGQTNPVLGDHAITDAKAVYQPTVWATQEELVAEYNSNSHLRRKLAAAGGDATLLRR